MFFIDNDQPKVTKRQIQRRARTDDQRRLAQPDHAPTAPPFGHGDPGVPFGRPRTKPRLDPFQELAGQGNFRQQHQGLTPLFQAFGNGLKIDLGLA